MPKDPTVRGLEMDISLKVLDSFGDTPERLQGGPADPTVRGLDTYIILSLKVLQSLGDIPKSLQLQGAMPKDPTIKGLET